MSSAVRRLVRSSLVAIVVLSALAVVPAAAADATVRITDSGFEPGELQVAPGTLVTWVNRSSDRHRVRTTSGPDKIDSGNLEPGERFSMRLAASGTYAYLDHRDEDDARYRGRIVVGGSGSGSGGGGTAGAADPGAPDAAASIGMAGRSFSPGSVTIQAGGTVTFVNDDDDEHSATSTDGAFDTGTLSPGEERAQRFPTPGTFAFLCVFHSDMTGEVVVEAAAGAEPAAPAPAATPTPEPTPTPSSIPSASTAGSEAFALSIVDFAFEPASLSVPAGSTVEVVNDGVAPHTVTAQDGSFDTGMLDAGARATLTLAVPGTFAYLCAVHPDMTGTIEVTAATSDVAGGGAATTTAAPTAVTLADEPTLATAGPSSPVSLVDPGPWAGTILAIALTLGGMILFTRTVRGSARRPDAG